MNLLALVLAYAVAGEPASHVTATTLDGREIAGELAKWDETGIEIKAGSAAEELAAAELLELRREKTVASARPEPIVVRLVDGTELHAGEFIVKDRNALVVGSPVQGRIPLAKIRSVEFVPRTDPSAQAWQALDTGEAGDVLVVAKKEKGAVDYLVGEVGDVSPEQIDFNWEGDRVPVKRNKAAAIGFFAGKAKALPSPVCLLTLDDGGRVAARTIALAGAELTVTTPAGVKLAVPWDQVTRADFSAGKLAYLSDLDPIAAKWTPYIGVPNTAKLVAASGLPRRDVSFGGSPLSLAWGKDVAEGEEGGPDAAAHRDSVSDDLGLRIYRKGLALRSRTELSYRVPEGMRRLAAIAGIDPPTRDQGRVTLEIRGDDRVLWEGEIAGRDKPVEIDVELAGARRLQLAVGYGSNLDYGDRLHLVEARFTK